jgi:DNA-binding IclR family transcriptional regulator
MTSDAEPAGEKTGVAALDRALTIVGCYTARDKGLTLNELAERTGFYKSTILRLCASLQKFGYLVRLGDGRFVLGSALFRLGQIYQRAFDIADFVTPHMQSLAHRTGLSASFWIREADHRVCLYRAEAAERMRDMTAQAGERWPLERGGSASTVLLAFAGAKGARFERARQDRFAVSLGEFVPELAAISVPVFGAGGDLMGALSLGGFRSHFAKAAIPKLRREVGTAGHDISAALGADLSAIPSRRS